MNEEQRPSEEQLETLLNNQAFRDEVKELAHSETDVTWGETYVLVVLRNELELASATELGFEPTGSTLALPRKNIAGVTFADEDLQNIINYIKRRPSNS